MTDQYQKRDINNGENAFFRRFLTTDPIVPPFLSPSQQLSIQTQLAVFDTQLVAGIVLLPSALAAGPNAVVAITAVNSSSFPLTITSTVPGEIVLVSAGFLLVIASDNVTSTFRSNGVDSWIGASQTS